MKGQWFIISAAIIAGILFTISMLFQSYGAAESSQIADIEEDFYFKNLKTARDSLASYAGDQNKIIKEFKYFAELESAKIGILAAMDETTKEVTIQTSRFSATG